MQAHKVVFLGDSSVGKTTIISQIMFGQSKDNQSATIGIDFFAKNITVGTETVRIQMWDTAGQEQYRSVIPSYLRDSAIAVIIYDITNQESFEHIDLWVKMVQDVSKPAIIIVGNKTDLEEIRAVPEEDGQKIAQTYNADFVETSAKKPSNMDKLLDIISHVPFDSPASEKQPKVDIKEENSENNSTCFC